MQKFLLLFEEHRKKGICDGNMFHESLRGSNELDVYLSWYFFQRLFLNSLALAFLFAEIVALNPGSRLACVLSLSLFINNRNKNMTPFTYSFQDRFL